MSDSEEFIIPINKTKKFKIIRDRKIVIKTKTEAGKKLEQIEQIKKRQQRENIFKSKSDKEELLALEGKQFIYSNQKEAADKCIEAYKNGAVAVCLIAMPGTGKTGTAQAVMIHMTTNSNDDEIIYSENIINCTGMSDNDWETQFKDNVLLAFKDNIFHRQNLIRQTDKLRTIKDALIIPDECHIASGSKMTIAKILKEAGILNIDVLEIRNIKMLDISATPDAVLHDYKKWGSKCAIIKIQPGLSYKGFEVMLEEKRIINAPILEEQEDYYDLLESLDIRYKNTTKKYFIFRLLDTSKTIILETVCKELGWEYKNHNSTKRINEIDVLMKTPPKEHTIFAVKGFWRASKRISRQHIGATYEPIPKKRDVSVTSQSLVARDCDNYEYSGDQLDINFRPLHYCDKGAIEQYVEWFNNDCDFITSKYSSHRISSNGKGNVSSKETKVNPNIFSGINYNSDSEEAHSKPTSKPTKQPKPTKNTKPIIEPIIKKFNTQEEVKEYYNSEKLKAELKEKSNEEFKKELNEKIKKELNKELKENLNEELNKILKEELNSEKKFKFKGRGPIIRKINKSGFYETTLGNDQDKTKIRSTKEIYDVRMYWLTGQKNPYRFYPCYSDINNKDTLEFWFIHN